MECRSLARSTRRRGVPRVWKMNCCVAGCEEVTTSRICTFHTIPKDFARRRQWELALGINFKKGDRVCSIHFQESDYIKSQGLGIRARLKRNSVPSPMRMNDIESELEPFANEHDMLDKLRFLKELECPAKDMTVTSEELPELKEEAENILTLIKSKECKLHIDAFLATCQDKEEGSIWSGALGPYGLFHDLAPELMTALDVYDENNLSTGFKYGILLPEVIVWSIMRMKMCSRKLAEEHFDNLSKKTHVVKDPLQEK